MTIALWIEAAIAAVLLVAAVVSYWMGRSTDERIISAVFALGFIVMLAVIGGTAFISALLD